MGDLLTDRAKVLPLLAVMVVIAVGATLIILLTKPSSDSAGPTGGGGATAQQSVDGGAGKAVKIAIVNFKYKPVTLTIKPGTTVAWTDEDSSNHTATGKGFDTGSINKGQTRSITFKKSGTYKYLCSFHPFMHGTIVVR